MKRMSFSRLVIATAKTFFKATPALPQTQPQRSPFMHKAACGRSALVILVLLLFCSWPPNARAQTASDLETLGRQIDDMTKANKLDEAVELAERLVKLSEERFGTEDQRLQESLGRLSMLQIQAGQLEQAERVLRRLIAIIEKNPGSDASEITNALNQLAYIYGHFDKSEEAEKLYIRTLAIAEKTWGEQSDVATFTMYNLLLLDAKTNRDIEAISVGERVVALLEQKPNADPGLRARIAGILAAVHSRSGHPQRAEQLFQGALVLWQKAPNPDPKAISEDLNNLGVFYQSEHRLGDAEGAYAGELAISDRANGPDSDDSLSILRTLAGIADQSGRWKPAAGYLSRFLASAEKRAGPDHPGLAVYHHDLALMLEHQGLDSEAERHLKRALEIREKQQPSEPRSIAQSLDDLAQFCDRQHRFTEAEALHQRSLWLLQTTLGPTHPDAVAAINNLAAHYSAQERFTEAEALYRRVIEIREGAPGSDPDDIAVSLNNLATMLENAGRQLDEAEKLEANVVAIYEKKFGASNIETLRARRELASIYALQGRRSEAIDTLRQVLGEQANLLGKEHPETVTTLGNLAALVYTEKQYTEAQDLAQQRLALTLRTLGPDSLEAADSLHDLGWVEFHLNRYKRALELFDKAAAIYIARAQNPGTLQEAEGAEQLTAQQHVTFYGRTLASYRLAEQEPSRVEALRKETFELAQWATFSEAAGAIAQMSARIGSSSNELSTRISESQDLAEERKGLTKQLVANLSLPANERSLDGEGALHSRIAAIGERLKELAGEIEALSPKYAALINPRPLSVSETQKELYGNEALVQFLIGQEKSFVWAVTSNDVQWAELSIGAKALSEKVQTLRCGLDLLGQWSDPNRSKECVRLLNLGSNPQPLEYHDLPFSLAVAYDLYQALLKPLEKVIQGKRLLIVPSPSLSSIPFHVLVTSKATVGIPRQYRAYHDAAWLAKTHAITILPSVASLRALRELAAPSKAMTPYLGFGNPLLVGPQGTDHSAWQKLSCRKGQDSPDQVASRGVANRLEGAFRGGLADVEEIRKAQPLPETADELCTVAATTGGDDKSVYLGDRDTETNIKTLSANGALANAHVLHIATHGLLAAETETFTATRAEPALIFTPPETPTEEDDGLLTASEIARLRLDADWVVLSACNTAAANEKQSVSGFSGLARAFFYAGARALLVSHWYVDSHATVALITKSFAVAKQNVKGGRSAALQAAMLSLIESAGPEAHPAYWAPFSLIGEGS
jgi:CHAT domain-containing protein